MNKPVEVVQPIRDVKKLEAMKALLKGKNVRDYALFVMGINSGLRISDLLKLTVGDVLDAKGKPRDRITLREQKTGKAKDFPVGSTTVKALKEYLETRPDAGQEEPLFLSKKGGGIGRVQAWQIISDAAKAVGVTERVGTHTLRKTFGFHAYKRGVDLAHIQKLLNHSSPGVTLAYIGITQDDLDRVYLDLNL